ncbi:MAG: sugar ABC transporter permease [Spirochaetes bacterium]|nr:sugar ABC transporter permease [Spirochaetota bacterium]
MSRKTSLSKLVDEKLAGYIFIFPWLIGIFGLTMFPMLVSMYISFCKYDLLGSPKWIGLKNFYFLFVQDQKFFTSLRITFFYVLTAVPLRLIFSLIIAMILNRKGLNTGIYRTVYYLPSIIGTSVAVAIVWRELFGTNGLINKFTALFGYQTNITLAGMPETAIWVVILLYMWEFGSSMLIFLAGLQNIPEMYYEAAIVEGAGFWRKFFYITIPLLSPILLFNMINQMIHGFLVFTQVYIITQGGPVDATLVYALYMFRRAFEFQDMGAASAMAWIMLLIVGSLSILVFYTSKYWVHYESKEGK